MPPPEKPRPRPKPKPKLKMGPPEVKKPIPLKPVPEPERVGTPGGDLIGHQPFSCATYPLCPPPPAPPATVHLRSGHLPTPLIVLSASVLSVSALLLIALLVRYLIRRRRGPQEVLLAQQQSDDEERVLGVDAVVAGGVVGGEEGEEEEVDSGDGGMHHVWYIRTKGLDERAIAAIAAVVYDAKKRGGAVDADGGCAVCLADFRDGETLRLLPRCGHAFHRGCIDTWLRAHVNCPLCRAPVVQAAASAGKGPAAALAAPGTAADGEAAAPDTRTEQAERRVCPPAARAVRRAASMLTLPRRVAWPDVPLQEAPAASNSAREEDMTGLAKIRRLLKFSEALDMARIGVGRSVSFGAGSLPTRSGPSTATTGVNSGDELE